MITDTEIKVKGMETLIEALGKLNTERFITLLLREPFDYTKWQRNLWTDRSIEEISQMAMHHRLADAQVEQNEEPQSELKVDMLE
jgi:hypothetical protein